MQIQLMVGHLIILLQVFKQWGLYTPNGKITINFPVAFTTACYALVNGAINKHSDIMYGIINWSNITKTGFSLTAYKNEPTNYIAIGK